MCKNKVSPMSADVEERETNCMPEQTAARELRVALVGEITHARRTRGLTQKKLEELSGVRQPIIARLEKGTTDPQLSTILKVLASLGKTLVIAPIDRQ